MPTAEEVRENYGLWSPDDRTVNLINDRYTAAAGAQIDKIRALLKQGVIAPGPTFNTLK